MFEKILFALDLVQNYYIQDMVCPFCSYQETSVTDSRKNTDGSVIRRRRNCIKCNNRFTTYETAEIQLIVVKKNKTKEDFDFDKLIVGINNACVDTGIDEQKVNEIADDISLTLHKKGNQVTSAEIGELVLGKLKELSEVAYIRYASVYKEFSEVSDFEKEAAELD